MRRHLKSFFLSVIILFFQAVSGQSYLLQPDDTLHESGSMEDLHILRISQLNSSSDSIRLKWKKLSADVPLKWDAATCDNVFCNTILGDSGTMNPVPPSGSGFLEMHITPKINYGTSVIRYMVWDAANPSVSDTLTYILNVSNTSIEELPLNLLWVSSDMLHFSDPSSIRKVQVYDFSGRILISSELHSSGLSLVTLRPGFYYVLLFDKQQKLYFKKICYEGN